MRSALNRRWKSYRARHYIISLKPERLALPENARFAGMRAELQIQTLLNHAWSQTKVSNLQQVLQDETAAPQAVEIIRSLIDRVEVRPGPGPGRCEVTLVAALAQILGFASKRPLDLSHSAVGT